MTNKKKIDSKYFIAATIVFALNLIVGLIFLMMAIGHIFQDNALGDEFFEFFYFLIHIIFNVIALAFSFKAIKYPSFIIRPLMYNRYNEKVKSRTAPIICIIGFVLFSALLVYSLLLYNNVGIYDFHFTKTLKSLLIVVSSFMMSVSALFFIYPIIYKSN